MVENTRKNDEVKLAELFAGKIIEIALISFDLRPFERNEEICKSVRKVVVNTDNFGCTELFSRKRLRPSRQPMSNTRLPLKSKRFITAITRLTYSSAQANPFVSTQGTISML